MKKNNFLVVSVSWQMLNIREMQKKVTRGERYKDKENTDMLKKRNASYTPDKDL